MGGKEGEGFWQDERGQRQKESMGVSLDPRSVGTRVTLALYWRDSSLFFTQNCRCSLPVSVCTVTHTHTHIHSSWTAATAPGHLQCKAETEGLHKDEPISVLTPCFSLE